METKEKLENFEKYKKQFEIDGVVKFEKFEKYFYVKDYFLSKTTPYLEEKFFETSLQIINNVLKGTLQELEYYVNVKPQTPLMTSDYEILKGNEEILKLYYQIHIIYKKNNLFWLEGNENTSSIFENVSEIMTSINNFRKILSKVQLDLIDNLSKKLKEVDQKDKPKLDSSIFH